MDIPINYFAVVVAAIIPMIVGYLWYGPLFGKEWSRLSGVSMGGMSKAPASNYIIMFVGALIMSFVLAHAVIFANAYMQTSGAAWGATIGLLNWLGFIAPVTLGVVLWEGKAWKLWMLNSGYYLVNLVLMGILLSLWQ